jgi:signal peptidase II
MAALGYPWRAPGTRQEADGRFLPVPSERSHCPAPAVLGGTFLIVVALDQGSKYLAEVLLPPGGAGVSLLGGALSLTQTCNPGLAFGVFPGAGPAAILGALLLIGSVTARLAQLVRRGEPLHPLLAAGLPLALGGALGNTLDRLRLGAVVDFIALRGGLVLNVADAAITLGVLALLIFLLTGEAQATRRVTDCPGTGRLPSLPFPPPGG